MTAVGIFKSCSSRSVHSDRPVLEFHISVQYFPFIPENTGCCLFMLLINCRNSLTGCVWELLCTLRSCSKEYPCKCITRTYCCSHWGNVLCYVVLPLCLCTCWPLGLEGWWGTVCGGATIHCQSSWALRNVVSWVPTSRRSNQKKQVGTPAAGKVGAA